MRQLIKRALRKLDKLGIYQLQDILLSAAGEIERLETVLDSLSVGLLVCDTDHKLVMINKYALRLFLINSYDQEPVWNLINDEKLAAFLEKTLKSGDKVEEWEFDAVFSGKNRLYNLSVWPLVENHKVSGSLIHATDITERRSREARMRRMENLASLTTLAAGVAHEIKNPLASLSIHVQLIKKASSGGNIEAIDRYLEVVNEEIERLNQIVVDFLFAVRPMDLEMRLGNINLLIDELLKFLSFELEEANIVCNLELFKDLPLIDFDARFMKQAFLNLIKNAIAAMSGGGILSIKTETQEGLIMISFSDTGIGIPDENMSKIFEPYFTTKETGSGLGLTLVFKIIREHQGEINVISKQGEGTIFCISMPIPQSQRLLIGAP